MKTKIKIPTVILAIFFLGFSSCQQDSYSLGDLTGPTNLVITADIVGKTAISPNGDGSGVVNFTFSAKDAISYKVDFGTGLSAKISPASIQFNYKKVGVKHYRIVVTANGKGGSTATAIKEIDVYYAYTVDPATVTMLTGDSATGKKWQIDSSLPDNLGLGPGPGRPDGNAESFKPDWYTCGVNGKAANGIYDDIYTFTNTKVFTHQTNNTMYGYKTNFIAEFDTAAPGVFGGFGDEWILTYPTYTDGFDYDGTPATDTAPKREFINFDSKGHCGFFIGIHKYMILSITPTSMWLRATPNSGTNVNAWYVRLKAI